MLFMLACLPFASLISQSTEITPQKYNWINSPVRDGVHLQIKFNDGGVISKKTENLYITVWIRNSSNKTVTVPYPGDHLVNGLVNFLDHNDKSMLRGVPCARSRVPHELELGIDEQKGIVVNVIKQDCSIVDKHLLKRGAYFIEFMGYKKAFDLID